MGESNGFLSPFVQSRRKQPLAPVLTYLFMPLIRVVILWHEHQPFYKDLVTGEYRLPWFVPHALKDYYGMVKLFDEFPTSTKPSTWFRRSLPRFRTTCREQARFFKSPPRPAQDLTHEERRFALQISVSSQSGQYDRAISGYRELWDRFRGSEDNPERAAKHFQPQDFTDLQVLSQIAWFDEFFLEDPGIAELIKKGQGFSFEDQRSS